jgi:argininosuccinate lyase
LDNPKYQYIFSVDTLNDWVRKGMPFRDAYKKMVKTITKGEYVPKKNLDHTHLGSMGNLALKEIDLKMKKVM